MRVHPLLQELVSDIRGTLWLLLAAIGLVLLIACVNIASLFLTRAISRERELAMRAALGASRSRLLRQCITESALLGVCGGFLGLLAAALNVHPFVAVWPGSLPRDGRNPYRLARTLFRSGHLAFMRSPFWANAGVAGSHASARRGAARRAGGVSPGTRAVCTVHSSYRRSRLPSYCWFRRGCSAALC